MEVGKNHKDLLIHVNVRQRPSIAEEVLNWMDNRTHHPAVASQLLSLATLVTVQWAHEQSSLVGRDRSYAWAQSLGSL